MYTGIVCLVLFDARGTLTEPYWAAALLLAACMLGIKYIPALLHRPRQVSAFCEDVLHISTHASVVAVLPCANHLRYACALHCTCYVMQHRFLKCGPVLLMHTITSIWLVAAYAYGPRISELQTFIVAVVCPHALDTLAGVLTHIQKFTELYLMEI
jgi:hypothetical protein